MRLQPSAIADLIDPSCNSDGNKADILSGIRIVELAAWKVVSAAGVVLAGPGLSPSQGGGPRPCND